MKRIFSFLALTIALGWITLGLIAPVRAADVVYPRGSHVGLVPLDGLKAAQNFPGFEDTDAGVKVLVTELPAAAFTTVETQLKNPQQPADAPKPESFDTAAGKSYLNHETATDGGAKVDRFALLVAGADMSGYVVVQVPEKAATTYSGDAIRKMLATTTMRADVPVQEQLAVLPFKVTNLADFKKVRIIPPGAAVTLSDANDNVLDLGGPPYIVVSLAPISATTDDDRARIARDLVNTLPGLKNVQITNAEPMRISGTPGFEIRLDATTAKDDKPISLVQWLRFGSNATLRMVGGAAKTDWAAAFPRFRAVRDGIDPQQ
jgi:hypothetical protein